MKKFFPLVFLLMSCDKSEPEYIPVPPSGDRFENVPLNYVLTRPLAEASGIADSRTFSEHLWVEEDSGNPARLFLLKHNGSMTDSFYLEGATNRDWEDIAVANGPDNSLSYLYVADIGDNDAKYPSYTIYRAPEPKNFADNITEYDSIKFTYPDGSHDAEALLVDDASLDIYIITKRDAPSKVYKIPYPQDTQNMNQAEFVRNIDFGGQVVSATLSEQGTEMIVKTYTQLYYYSRTAKEGLDATLAKVPTDTLAYQLEAQGESVAFANNNSGFFTLSEIGMSNDFPNLLYYRRKR